MSILHRPTHRRGIPCPGPRTSRSRVGATLLVLALVLAGCSGLPTSTPVERGLEVGAPNFQPIRLQFEAPAPGATPTQIVEGFLAASWSADDDYAAARAYLTPEASRRWRPKDQVTVYPSSDKLSLTPQGESVSLRVPVAARVDSSGRYQAASPGEVVSASVELAKVGGEWRVSHLPNAFGVWLSRFYFERSYRSLTLTYADPFDRTLIVDHRWFPLGPGLATTLARAQLDPVPTYLRGAAISGITPRTDLAVDSVPIVDQVADIELTSPALSATTDQRRAAWAQFLLTMRQVPGVTAVRLSVDGTPLQVLGSDALPTNVEALGYSSSADAPPAIVVRKGSSLEAADFSGWLRGGENQRAVPARLPQVPSSWLKPAVSRDLDQVAAVDEARSTLFRWTPAGAGRAAPFGSSLTEPALDRRGRTWVAGVDQRGTWRIWWVPSDAPAVTTPTVLEATWLRGAVTAVKPSPGGRRLAISITDAAGVTSVYVAGITVDQGGRPVALSAPWRVATGLTGLTDLAWADSGTLAAVASADGAAVGPVLLPLGGPPEVLTPVRDATEIMTSGGVRGVIVLTSAGAVWRRIGNGWQHHGQVDDLIVPGS